MQGATLFMGCLSMWALVLGRWSGQDDIVIGAATANRNYHPDLGKLLGYFANELAIRVDLSGQPSFTEASWKFRLYSLLN